MFWITGVCLRLRLRLRSFVIPPCVVFYVIMSSDGDVAEGNKVRWLDRRLNGTCGRGVEMYSIGGVMGWTV